MRTVFALVLVLAAVALTSCKSATALGVSLDVPLFGHLELRSDPVKCVTDEVGGAATAVGLASRAK
jgi:hypothetical protein